MLIFLAKRLALAIVTLFLVSVIVFAVSQVLPGDVGRVILGPYATNAQVAHVDKSLGLDQPVLTQYGHWLSGFFTGSWGMSFLQKVPVRPLVLTALLHSLILAGFAFVLIVPISIGAGVVSALRYGKAADRAISITGLSLLALPEFVSGTILLVIFAVVLKWFPVSSAVPQASFVDVFRQLLLPAIPMMCVLFGYISRMARAGTVDALDSNYVRTAVLKGLPRRRVVARHVLRNSLLPTITVVSVQVGYLVGGLVVVETLFNYQGIGLLIYNSAVGHDEPVLEAAVLMIAIIYTLANLIADLLYASLNPRIRLRTA